ncbi:MAG: FAD-dependent oxidoreductase [Alphaproteobacteria bacterium]|nr:FAD-dependent oxidoreductase [Alphaproteobacteria bacterium]MCB9792167.1 FAD-dependent oxidoreductase [Alphaproteobacteria bacterium]
MLRRTFLKLLAAGSLVGSEARATQPPPREPGAPPHVVVVGAGPAGFSAALELAERGVKVTLLEAEGEVGGKVKGWTETLGEREVDVEHGMHGWWHQYVHFTDLLQRHGLGGALNAPDKRGAYRGAGWELDANTRRGFRDFVRLFREKAIGLGYTPYSLRLRQGLRWLQELDTAKAREAMGGLSVTEWHAKGAPLTLWRVFPDVTAHSMYFMPPEEVDAAEFGLGERFYFGLSRRTVQTRWLKGNPQELIWAPLSARLEALGGELRLGARVSEVLLHRGRAVGVQIGRALPGAWLEELPQGWTQIDREGLPPLFVGREGLELSAFSGRCTHAGCPLSLTEEGFACPCHGGRFNFRGEPVAGPPKQPLQRLFVDEGADGVQVEGEPPPEPLFADAVILALDVPGLQAVAGDLLPECLGLETCGETVARFWLDRDVSPEAGHACIFQELPHISNGFLVHRLQDKARAWAKATGGAVIELQAYRDIPQDAEPEALLDLIEADLRVAWPELAEAKVLKRTLTRDDRFTAFRPGWHAHASPVETRVPGLLLAGDHVDIERNCAFMEKAVTTGRMAANVVLRGLGLPEAPILPERKW